MKNKKNYIVIGLLFVALVSFGLYFVIGGGSKEYRIMFNTAGGNDIETQTVKEGESAQKPANPTKENSTFVGWVYDGAIYDFSNKVTHDITLVAKWEEEAVKYDVKFTVEGKEKVLTLSTITESDIASLELEEKEGYEIKWYLEDKEYDITTPLTGNISIVGKYEKITEYTIKFNSNGGTSIESQKLKANEKVKEPEAITKEGYIFVEWQLDGQKYDFSTPVTKSITLTAKWEEDPNVKRYEITFDSDGGSKVEKQRVIENKTVSEPKKPTKAGYTFVEWDLDGKKYDFKTKVTKNITLKAKWEEDAKYTVTFDSSGGSKVNTQTVKKGNKAIKPSNPTKEGYTFVEWLYNNSTYDFNKEVTDNITLTARYTKKAVVTPTPTPTPKVETYTFKAIPVDDYSPDVEIVVYDENNKKVNVASITIGGVAVQGMVVNKYEITGVNTITAKLSNGKTITAKKG